MLIEDEIENINAFDFAMPDVVSTSAQFKITTMDTYGNYNENTSSLFNIGHTEPEENIITNVYIEDNGQSDPIIMDVVKPEIYITYPNGGEFINNYQEANISCPIYDDNLLDHGLEIEI